MFDILSNLTKAAVSVAVTPITAVVDVLALPIDAESNDDAFHRTAGALKSAELNFKAAVTPTQ